MRVIPVLDLMSGVVVRAQGGRRDEYRPIVTPLSTGADPVSVVEGLRTIYPFDTVYVADLDAIAGASPDTQALARIAGVPGVEEIWIDAGTSDAAGLEALLALPYLRPVLGSESQVDPSLVRRFARDPRIVLSLDFFADGYRGPPGLLEDVSHWPSTVIVMTLAEVGRSQGADRSRLADIAGRADGRVVVAAGGVRDARDLDALAADGIGAALVATALHAGTISGRDIARLA